jgi:hypothetical protein
LLHRHDRRGGGELGGVEVWLQRESVWGALPCAVDADESSDGDEDVKLLGIICGDPGMISFPGVSFISHVPPLSS